MLYCRLSSKAILAVVLISTGLIPFAFDMFFVGQLDIARYFDLQYAAPILYLWSWGMCLGQIVMAPLLDSFGRKHIFVVAMIINILLSIMAVLIVDVTVLYTIRFLQGMAASVQMVGSRAIVWDLFRTNENYMARAYNMTIVFTLIFALIALNLSSWLVTQYGWKMLFIFLAGYSLILVTLLVMIPETLAVPQKLHLVHSLKVYAKLLIQKGFMAYTLIGGLIYAFLFATFTGLPVIFSQVYNLNAYQISQLFSLNLLCGIFGGFINNWLIHKNISYRFLLVLGNYVIAIVSAIILGLALFFDTLSLWVFIPLFLCIHVFLIFITANSMTAAINEVVEHTGTACALFGIVQFGMGAFASAMVPVVFNWLDISLFSLFIICVVSMLLILFVDFCYNPDPNDRSGSTGQFVDKDFTDRSDRSIDRSDRSIDRSSDGSNRLITD